LYIFALFLAIFWVQDKRSFFLCRLLADVTHLRTNPYGHPSKHDPQESGKCVGAIVGKNPGSAKPTQLGVWGPLNLDGDKMLPSVRNRFVAAYK
jgi:hypothetical protein